ncbi:hypothetical protein ACTMPN_00100, partial [Lacticaseibacillus paracasei]|uniref:hypothetical protein n=1 Tax=Lacticaseibacillus paracasei TaxID=1597 RepID=UPI003F88A2AF
IYLAVFLVNIVWYWKYSHREEVTGDFMLTKSEIGQYRSWLAKWTSAFHKWVVDEARQGEALH